MLFPVSRDAKDSPSIKSGYFPPANSMMVGARSILRTGFWINTDKQTIEAFVNLRIRWSVKRFTVLVTPFKTPGPRTMSGTRMSNSYICRLSKGNENWPEAHDVTTKHGCTSQDLNSALMCYQGDSRCRKWRWCTCFPEPSFPLKLLQAFQLYRQLLTKFAICKESKTFR